jgi:hypothetical protein
MTDTGTKTFLALVGSFSCSSPSSANISSNSSDKMPTWRLVLLEPTSFFSFLEERVKI